MMMVVMMMILFSAQYYLHTLACITQCFACITQWFTRSVMKTAAAGWLPRNTGCPYFARSLFSAYLAAAGLPEIECVRLSAKSWLLQKKRYRSPKSTSSS